MRRWRERRLGHEFSERPVPAEKGWRRLSLPITGDAAPVAFEVETARTAGAYFCFDATIRRAR